jgi:hypothetical protein
MIRKIIMASALFAGMAILGHQSSAQQFDKELFKVIRPVTQILASNPAVLLTNTGVQKELKLDEEQIKAIGESKDLPSGFGFGGGFGGGKGGGKGKQDFNSDEFKERMAKMMEKYEKLKDVPEDQLEDKIREVFKDEIEKPTEAAKKILKPDQMKRLVQIGHWNAGVRGLVSSSTVKALGVTDEQKTKIQAIADDTDKDIGELRRAGGGGGKGGGKGGKGGFGGFNISPETQEKIAALRKESMEKAMDTLTAEQKSKWKDYAGEHYEVKFEMRARPKKDD